MERILCPDFFCNGISLKLLQKVTFENQKIFLLFCSRKSGISAAEIPQNSAENAALKHQKAHQKARKKARFGTSPGVPFYLYSLNIVCLCALGEDRFHTAAKPFHTVHNARALCSEIDSHK